MHTAYFHCASGISGDMLLGALISAGAHSDRIETELKKLPLPKWAMTVQPVNKSGFHCMKLDFQISEEKQHRHLGDIQSIINSSKIRREIKERALGIFDLLAHAEAAAHGIDITEVHFHEVGAIDSILDIVGVVIALDDLGINAIAASPLPLGQGEMSGCHGMMPLPAPALQFMLPGIPVYGKASKRELVTPTGLAILKSLHCNFGEFPAMTVTAVGTGGGTAEFPWPNLLRVFIGTKNEKGNDCVLQIETVIDDMTGEAFGYLWEHIFSLGALDCYYIPIQMKKGRPGIKIHVLCSPDHALEIENFLFAETSTFGLIERTEFRRIIKRDTVTVKIDGGMVRIKQGQWDAGEKAAPEYDDIKKIAIQTGKPMRALHLEAMGAYENQKNGANRDDG